MMSSLHYVSYSCDRPSFFFVSAGLNCHRHFVVVVVRQCRLRLHRNHRWKRQSHQLVLQKVLHLLKQQAWNQCYYDELRFVLYYYDVDFDAEATKTRQHHNF